jgi:hypothetical protein
VFRTPPAPGADNNPKFHSTLTSKVMGLGDMRPSEKLYFINYMAKLILDGKNTNDFI